MHADISIHQFGNIHVCGYAAKHIGVHLRHLFFVHQIGDHFPDGDMRGGVEVPVASHRDDVRGGLGSWPVQGFTFVDDELQLPDEGGLDGGDVDFPVALGSMAVADLEQRSFYENWVIDSSAGDEFLVIQVAAMDPWWGAVPATGFLWRGYAQAAEKRMQGDLYSFRPVGDHFFCIQLDDLHLAVEDLVRQEASCANGIITVGNSQIDGLQPHFEDVAGFRAFDIDGAGENVTARAFVLHGLHIA